MEIFFTVLDIPRRKTQMLAVLHGLIFLCRSFIDFLLFSLSVISNVAVSRFFKATLTNLQIEKPFDELSENV